MGGGQVLITAFLYIPLEMLLSLAVLHGEVSHVAPNVVILILKKFKNFILVV